jgi:hypothetical protein
MYSGLQPLAPLLLQEIVLPSGARGGMQRLAQVPHQAEARNRCSGLGLGKPDRGKSLPSNRKGSSTPNGNNHWHKQSEFKSMKIQLRNKGLELENLHLRQKAEKTRATVQPTQGPTPLTSPSYAAAARTQAPGVTGVAPLSLSPNDIQVEIRRWTWSILPLLRPDVSSSWAI